jgi:hypothetical protein
VLLLVIIAGPIKHQLNNTSDDYDIFSITGTLQSTGSIVFSLSCASANFQAFITTEKSHRNMAAWRCYFSFFFIYPSLMLSFSSFYRRSVITGRAVSAGAIMCVVMGLVGYLSFGPNTSGMILDNFPQHGYDFFKVSALRCCVPGMIG